MIQFPSDKMPAFFRHILLIIVFVITSCTATKMEQNFDNISVELSPLGRALVQNNAEALERFIKENPDEAKLAEARGYIPKGSTAMSQGAMRSFPPPSNSTSERVPEFKRRICTTTFSISLETFGEVVSVELRKGFPGSSLLVSSRRSDGGHVEFNSLCEGTYFLAIGDADIVSVTPIREFHDHSSYASRIVVQRGSGNVGSRSRKSL